MNKLEDLRNKAAILEAILKKYSPNETYAEMMLTNMERTFEEIRNGTIDLPKSNKYSWYFFSTDSPLFKYTDLVEAAAQYSKSLELWGPRKNI